jgi:tetratricopeptide (TPR) repeat protein
MRQAHLESVAGERTPGANAPRRWRSLSILSFGLALQFLAAAPVLAQSRAAAPAVELTPEQEEALHTGMLQLRQLERSGNRPAAIAKGVELQKQFPGNRRVEDALMNLYRIERRDEDLLKLLRARFQRNPDDSDAARDLASMLLARKAMGEASDVLKRFIAANPLDENRYRVAGALLAGRDQSALAIQLYRQGREATGNETLFAVELAQLEAERGDYAAAITEYLLLASDPERRARVWREVSTLLQRADDRSAVLDRVEDMRKRHPKSAPIQDLVAMVQLQMGRYPQALSAIREADRYAGDQGEHLLDFGRMAIESTGPDSLSVDRARAGVDALELLPQKHPDSNLIPEAVKLASEGLVNLSRRLPDSPERRALLQQAVRILDANEAKLRSSQFIGQALALKGMILLEDLGQPEAALKVFEQAAAQQRDLGEPDQVLKVQMALCRAALGQLDAARTELEAVVRSDTTADKQSPFPGSRPQRRPRQPEQVGWARARYYLAEFDLMGGKIEEAKSGFAALAEEAPEDRLANDCLDLALVLNEASSEDQAALKRFGDYRRALLLRDRKAERTTLESIVRDSPQSSLAPVALFDLGEILAEDGESEAALARWQELQDKHPTHRLAPRALESSADLHVALHHPDQAVPSYEKLLMTYPDDLFLDGVRKKLLAARAAGKGGTNATP